MKRLSRFRHVKNLAGDWVIRYRQRTAPFRALPDFIIIGAQKSGTTSLYHYLKQHPQISPAIRKEVHFFDGGLRPEVDTFAKGAAWHRAHFPLRRKLGHDVKVFEASPLYMFHPLAPDRIASIIPDVKLIAVLRDPVERAISHYGHEKRKGRESLPILEAMMAEESRLEGALREKNYKSHEFIHFSYKARGRYAEQLLRYCNRFPAENILILQNRDLLLRTRETLCSVFKFLGVNPSHKITDLTPRNTAPERIEIEQDVVEYLRAYFVPHNQKLCDVIGQDPGW